MKAWRLFALPLLVCVTGCEPLALDVDVSGTIDDVHISISLPRELFEFSVKPTDVREVEVRDWSLLAAHPDDVQQPQPQMWLVQASSCQPAVTNVRYGTTPAGFAVRAPAHPLREGGTYMVGIEGCDHLHNEGLATFRIVHGRAVAFVWK